MKYISCDCDKVLYHNEEQQDPNLEVFDGLKDSILDYLFVADDSEWVPVNRKILFLINMC